MILKIISYTIRSFPLFLIGCGFSDPCDNCEIWSEFIDACKDELDVTFDCYSEVKAEWFDEYGYIKWDDPVVTQEYDNSLIPCSSKGVTYNSCKMYEAAASKAASSGGNKEERNQTCIDNQENNPDRTQAMEEKNCEAWWSTW